MHILRVSAFMCVYDVKHETCPHAATHKVFPTHTAVDPAAAEYL